MCNRLTPFGFPCFFLYSARWSLLGCGADGEPKFAPGGPSVPIPFLQGEVAMHELKSRQMAGIGNKNIAENHIDSISHKEPHYRECGLDLPFIDVTRMSGDEKEVGNKEFDHPGPDVLGQEPMPVAGDSSLYPHMEMYEK